MRIKSLPLVGLIQAVAVALYVILIAVILNSGEQLFGKMSTFWGPVAFLLLFVVSAAITGALTLARPLMLYFDNHRREGIKLFLWTIAWLVVVTLLALSLQIIFRVQ